MNRIEKAFQNKKAFIGFITGGDPDLETTKKLLIGMQQAGADLIEIGIPFSDPIAEGPVIQDADLRALAAGTTTKALFATLKEVREKMRIPLLLMTYINSIFTFGTEKFMKNCQESGIAGVIVPDLPFEEKGEIADSCKKYDVTLISMITPTSKERVIKIATEAEGFLYCVSSLGDIGMRSQIQSGIETLIADVKAVSNIPCAIGFGVSTPEQAKKMAQASDGVIVGSAIVKIIGEHGKNCVEPVKKYVAAMKNAI